jgi:hypothetical protein
MFEKQSHLSPLEMRKQLLIAESELNRAHLCQEWRTVAQGIRDTAHRAKTAAAWVSLAALLTAGVRTLRRDPPPPPAGKSSWLQMILSGAGVVSTLWSAFVPRAK